MNAKKTLNRLTAKTMLTYLIVNFAATSPLSAKKATRGDDDSKTIIAREAQLAVGIGPFLPLIVEKMSQLPACIKDRDGFQYGVEDKNAVYVCKQLRYVEKSTLMK